MKIAIVTGASNGMGREFAKILDRENLEEIWGIGLEEENLKQLADELATPFRAFAVDLTNGGVDQVVEQLQQGNHDVRWLVNSAGFGKFGRYDEIPVEQSTNMVRLNSNLAKSLVQPFARTGQKQHFSTGQSNKTTLSQTWLCCTIQKPLWKRRTRTSSVARTFPCTDLLPVAKQGL